MKPSTYTPAALFFISLMFFGSVAAAYCADKIATSNTVLADAGLSLYETADYTCAGLFGGVCLLLLVFCRKVN